MSYAVCINPPTCKKTRPMLLEQHALPQTTYCHRQRLYNQHLHIFPSTPVKLTSPATNTCPPPTEHTSQTTNVEPIPTSPIYPGVRTSHRNNTTQKTHITRTQTNRQTKHPPTPRGTPVDSRAEHLGKQLTAYTQTAGLLTNCPYCCLQELTALATAIRHVANSKNTGELRLLVTYA